MKVSKKTVTIVTTMVEFDSCEIDIVQNIVSSQDQKRALAFVMDLAGSIRPHNCSKDIR